jgi:hypothetical protein
MPLHRLEGRGHIFRNRFSYPWAWPGEMSPILQSEVPVFFDICPLGGHKSNRPSRQKMHSSPNRAGSYQEFSLQTGATEVSPRRAGAAWHRELGRSSQMRFLATGNSRESAENA